MEDHPLARAVDKLLVLDLERDGATCDWPELQDILKELRAALSPVWLPIDAAPRDGTTILVSDGREVDAAYWDYDDWCAPHSTGSSLPYKPSHWMRKPVPPN